MEVILTLRKELTLPVEAPEISPQTITAKSLAEIRSIQIWEGNRKVDLGEIFDVSEGRTEVDGIRIVGDVLKIRRIGYRMSSGTVVIDGNVGMYLGEEMAGGSILVNGNVDRWLGTKMKGGQIEVIGNAGDCVGAAYRGATLGMHGGTILIHGNAGDEVGCWMRDGIIRVKGTVGLMPGIHMSGGSILVEGDCIGRAGAQMRGGKVILNGHIPSVLPSFSFEEIPAKTKFGEEKIQGPFYLFSGDMNEDGKGKLAINVARNPQLKGFERFLET